MLNSTLLLWHHNHLCPLQLHCCSKLVRYCFFLICHMTKQIYHDVSCRHWKYMSFNENVKLACKQWLIFFHLCQPTTSALFQSTSPDSTTSPAQYSQSSGLFCRRSWGPTVWNSLPDSLHDPALSSDVRQLLKTNLLRRYHWVHTAHCTVEMLRCFTTLRYNIIYIIYKFMTDIDIIFSHVCTRILVVYSVL